MDIHHDLQTPREGQPEPVPNDGQPIFEMVIGDIRNRAQVALPKYGTYLQAHNGRNALQDAYEEVLDLAQYLRQEMVERDTLRARLATVEGERGALESKLAEFDFNAGGMIAQVEQRDRRIAELQAERDAARGEAKSLIDGQSLLHEKLAEANAHIDRSEAAFTVAQAGEARAVECLENIRKELKAIAEGKQEEVRNDFSSGEAHGWWMALQHFESFEIANSAAVSWLAQQRAEAAAEDLKKLGPLGSSNQELFMVPWGEIRQRIEELEAAALRAGATGGADGR